MQELFKKLPRYQLEHDLSARVMKRVEEHQIARDYRRFVFTAMPLGVAAFSLIGYRWYTFVRMNSKVFTSIADKFSQVSDWSTLQYWSSTFQTVRESLPMVELSLFAINIAILAIVALKFRGMWRNPLATGRNVVQI